MKRTLAVILATLLFSVLGFAQAGARAPMARKIVKQRAGMMAGNPLAPGMGAWWKNSAVAKALNLTDDQQQQLEKNFMDYRLKLVDLRADLERQEILLQPLMDANQLDEAAISKQLDAVIAARGRLEKTNGMMNVSLRKVLTPEQWQKLKAHFQQMARRRMMGGERFRRPDGRRGPGVGRGAPQGQNAPPPLPQQQ